jgi:hypothetical protein
MELMDQKRFANVLGAMHATLTQAFCTNAFLD